jgi:SWI/SNF-related matrix-associated actin-dependent regulator 1 of chromatin subfamily A
VSSEVQVASDGRPGWYYLVAASDDDTTVLTDLPGVLVENGRMLIHHSLVETDPRFRIVYNDPELWRRGQQPPNLDASSLLGALRPYQLEFLRFAAAKPGLVNADDLGTGKTIQALAALYATGLAPVLVVGTLLTKSVWCGPKGETMKWLGHDVIPLESRKNAGPEIFQEAESRWFFCHYDILNAWLPWIFNFMRPRAVVFDEAHNASPRTQRGRAAASISRFKEIRKRIVLSATPIQNKRIDLWPILNLAAPDAFGSRHQFGIHFCGGVHGEHGWIYQEQTHNGELKARLETLLIRRTKAEVLSQLPPIMRQSTEIELEEGGAKEYEQYKAAEQDIRKFLAAEGTGLPAGVGNERLVQITKLLALLSRLKLPTTISIAKEAALAAGKVVVFTWFKNSAATIADELKFAKIDVFGPINGEVPIAKRISAAQAFADHKSPAAFVATLASASESINQLSAAQELVISDLYWKPLVLLQAEGRLHRGGQQGSVHVNYVVVKNSIDESLLEAISKKADATATVGLVDDGKALAKIIGASSAPIDDLDTFIAAIQAKAAKESFEFDG